MNPKKKTLLTLALGICMGFSFITTPVLAQGAPAKGQPKPKVTLEQAYKKGRAEYYRGNLKAAEPYFKYVLKQRPDHGPSRYFMTSIKRQLEGNKGPKMERMLAEIQLPSLNLEDSTLPEVLEFFRIKARELSKGKFQPNFIVTGLSEEQKNGRITLQLGKLSMKTALKYVAEQAGIQLRYEEHAIRVQPKAIDAPQGPAPGEGSNFKSPSVAIQL